MSTTKILLGTRARASMLAESRGGQREPPSFERQVDEEQLRADGETIRAHRVGGGRVRIGPAIPRCKTVLHLIAEDISNRVGDLARALERPRVKPVREDLSAQPLRFVETTSEPNREALHPTLERKRVVRFDDEMDVVPLHAEVDDAEPEPLLAFSECFRDRREAPRASQARTPATNSHRHVHRSA